ncbi:DNA-processing protein DprA [Porphyromonas loveana]|uniref:DNA processing protein n=1 Tax=Porphyromonas loveana TaxID=1884669 RepID=A0A2U1FSF1_9PORP|nr:DNA-processing protein DprA [Porphyromonas loveana]PVZ15086.1 DNA processing protein [Porphyromonas loveana]
MTVTQPYVTEEQLLCRIALTLIKGVGSVLARQLLHFMGSPEAIFADRSELARKLPRASHRLIDAVFAPAVMERARRELEQIRAKGLQTYFITDENYPPLLKECVDAPILFYYKGNADLSPARALSVVGTRNITAYGRSATERIIADLAHAIPDLLIVSGLAYGVDVTAHKAALANGLPTVGVLAHGLDRIYPSSHRSVATEMLAHGGLLTDYPTGTEPERFNFVGRNRIVAGLSHATLVIESAAKGGSLITAELASDYNRDVLALPGRATDSRSAGCNTLIREQKAALVTSAEDILSLLSWSSTAEAQSQTLAFEPDNWPDTPVAKLLLHAQSISVDELTRETGLSINDVSAQLFDMELDGLIRSLPGGMYTIQK